MIPILLLVLTAGVVGWAYRLSLSREGAVQWVSVPELPREIAVYPTVFWEPLDTVSLRRLLSERPSMVAGKSVLEIGTGSGLLALCCAEAGAAQVTATDINPHAIGCAKANAHSMGKPIDFRLVPVERADQGAFSVVGADEKFDLIISNPPWEDDVPSEWGDYALYDPGFGLLRSILTECTGHLNSGGRVILVYGCLDAVRATRELCGELNLELVILDERNPETLPDLFLPGMMLGVVPRTTSQ